LGAPARSRSDGYSPVSPGGLGGAPGHDRRPLIVNVYLDGKKVGHAVSRALFEEERMYAGAATAGSPF
jgi:hypothetical protein